MVRTFLPYIYAYLCIFAGLVQLVEIGEVTHV
jgi:hypothetical protein